MSFLQFTEKPLVTCFGVVRGATSRLKSQSTQPKTVIIGGLKRKRYAK